MLFKKILCRKKVSFQLDLARYLNYSHSLINGVSYWISEPIRQSSGGNITAILVGIVAVIIIIIFIVMLFLYVSRYMLLLCWSSSVQVFKIFWENCQFVAKVFFDNTLGDLLWIQFFGNQVHIMIFKFLW